MSHLLDTHILKHLVVGGTLMRFSRNTPKLLQLQHPDGKWSRRLNHSVVEDCSYMMKHFPEFYSALIHKGLESMPKVSLPNGEFIVKTPTGDSLRGNSEGFYAEDIVKSLGISTEELNETMKGL
jgi:hypothetical protein